jgi:predicted ATPase
MSAVDRIEIAGYKSIRELDLKLASLNVLIGPNGAGKSNLISTFELMNEIVDRNLQLYVGKAGGANAMLHFGRKNTDHIRIQLTFGSNGYECVLAPTVKDSLIFEREGCWFHDMRYPEPYDIPLGRGHKESQLQEEVEQYSGNGIAKHVLRSIRSWRVYHFHDTSASSKMKASGDINDNADLRDDASNLAAFLYMLRERYPERYKKIVATVRLVAPFFGDFDLRPSRLNPDKIRLEWHEKGSDMYFNAHTLSDGTLRFICMVTLLLMPEPPATILIDEPELGLHPYAITLLAALLRSAATRTQVIVSTQSVTLVNQFDPEDIIVVDRAEGRSLFQRQDRENLERWLHEYGMGDMWEKNLLGGRPR